MSQNVVNFDFQGVVDLFIHEISGDWSQIVSKLDFPLKSGPQVLILLKNANIFLICDWSQIIECSVTGHMDD